MTRYVRRDEVEVALNTAPHATDDALEALVEAVSRLRQLRLSVKSAEATVRDLARRIAQEGGAAATELVLAAEPSLAPQAKPKQKPRKRRDFEAGSRIARFIEESFEGGTFEVTTVAEGAKTSYDTAIRALTRFAKRGVLVRVSPGLYRKA